MTNEPPRNEPQSVETSSGYPWSAGAVLCEVCNHASAEFKLDSLGRKRRWTNTLVRVTAKGYKLTQYVHAGKCWNEFCEKIAQMVAKGELSGHGGKPDISDAGA